MGKRYILIHAMTKDGLVPGAELLYRTDEKVTDYHGNMTAEKFDPTSPMKVSL